MLVYYYGVRRAGLGGAKVQLMRMLASKSVCFETTTTPFRNNVARPVIVVTVHYRPVEYNPMRNGSRTRIARSDSLRERR